MSPWIIYALLAALTAAAIPILAKWGLQGIDSTLATGLRAWVMALALTLFLALLGKWPEVSKATPRMAGAIVLSGLAGAASWGFGFLALRIGPAGPVAAVDRLGVVFTLLLAAAFLHERLTLRVALGGMLITLGAILIAMPARR